MKQSNIVSLIIGRSGSTLKDKNILPCLGYPLVQWTAAAALRSSYIDDYYVSSDCAKIIKSVEPLGFKPILRPGHLATDSSQSVDVVRHAFDVISKHQSIEILVVHHANAPTISSSDIDNCVELLLQNPMASSVIPCSAINEYHPYRSFRKNNGGFLEPFISIDNVSGNRQDLPCSFFFNHTIWVLRSSSINSTNGIGPWGCMGNLILPYIANACFDVHTRGDLELAEQWLISNKIPKPPTAL